ncbi:hypothetical protein ACB092_01G217300 [Castanea dentata]
MTTWSLWNARNRFHYEKTQTHRNMILRGASSLLEEYQRLTAVLAPWPINTLVCVYPIRFTIDLFFFFLLCPPSFFLPLCLAFLLVDLSVMVLVFFFCFH